MRGKKKKGERALTFEFKRSLEKGSSEISENRSGWNPVHLGVFFQKRTKARHFLPIISAVGYKVAWSTVNHIFDSAAVYTLIFISPLGFVVCCSFGERGRKIRHFVQFTIGKRQQNPTRCSKVFHFNVEDTKMS